MTTATPMPLNSLILPQGYPATEELASKASQIRVGIDGCPDGWIAAICERERSREIHFLGARTFSALFDWMRARNATAMVDMPIGLADTGRRACESLCRKRIGKRASSVFPAPRRPMLGFDNYADANSWGKSQGADAGGGLSKQAWFILDKIREIDEVISPSDQAWLSEAHPEFAFCRRNQEVACIHSKRTPEGARERLDILRPFFEAQCLADINQVRERFKERRFRVAKDDLVDALVLVRVAADRQTGSAQCLTDGAVDRRGLKLETWG